MSRAQELLAFILCGSYSSQTELNPFAVASGEQRQQILLLLNRDPRSAPQLSRELGLSERETREHLSALQRCGLIEESQGCFVPTFPIFTAEDQEKLHPWVDRLAEEFAGLIDANIDRIRAVYEACSFSRAGFPFEAVNYLLVAAYIFDYGGLWALGRAGLLKTEKEMPGGRYVFAAMERGVLAPRLRASWQWMWGHADQFNGFAFFSHGQLPAAGGRIAFPDLARRWRAEGRSPAELRRIMQEIGRILLALYKYGNVPSPNPPISQFKIEKEAAVRHIQLLKRLGYVEEQPQGGLRTACPVVDEEDSRRLWALVDELQAKLIEEALEPAWNSLERLYAETAPYRHRISLSESFNLLYHVTFDRACQRLLEGGRITWPKRRPDGARYAIWMTWDSTLSPSQSEV